MRNKYIHQICIIIMSINTNMDNSTNISELPCNPLVSSTEISENIQINNNNNSNLATSTTQHERQCDNQNQQQGVTLDPNTINQIVNELHQATITGSTQLSSRDIPTHTADILTDIQIQANHVPKPIPNINTDYISENDKNYESNTEILNGFHRSSNINNSIESIYSELQLPLLVSLLYFIFQMPFLKQRLFRYLPNLFLSDGNFNLNGFVFTSTLFAMFYYLLQKLTNVTVLNGI